MQTERQVLDAAGPGGSGRLLWLALGGEEATVRSTLGMVPGPTVTSGRRPSFQSNQHLVPRRLIEELSLVQAAVEFRPQMFLYIQCG